MLIACHFYSLGLKKKSKNRMTVSGWVRYVAVLLPEATNSQKVTNLKSTLRLCHSGACTPNQYASFWYLSAPI